MLVLSDSAVSVSVLSVSVLSVSVLSVSVESDSVVSDSVVSVSIVSDSSSSGHSLSGDFSSTLNSLDSYCKTISSSPFLTTASINNNWSFLSFKGAWITKYIFCLTLFPFPKYI